MPIFQDCCAVGLRPPVNRRLDSVGLVGKHLSHLSADRIEAAVAYAGLLVRVAHADAHLSAEERAALPGLIVRLAGLAQRDAEAIAQLVLQQAEGLEGIQYSSLTAAFNELATPEQKLQLIDCLYAIATADNTVSVEEDDEIRAVARALLLTHRQFIDVRTRYKDQLAVIQSLRELQKPS